MKKTLTENIYNKQLRKEKLFFCLIIIASLIFAGFQTTLSTSYGTNTTSSSMKDIKGHWSSSYVENAIRQGFVNGFPDGTFRPDAPVTRAQFTTMVNKALGLNRRSAVKFKDVPRTEWFYGEVEKGLSARYVGGYKDNTFRPKSPITRQEAAVMISRIITSTSSNVSLSKFPDRKSVADWAENEMTAVVSKGYIGAYTDGNLHPLDKLTRGQTAKIICDILDKETIAKSVNIKKKNTTVSNTIYTDTVTIDKALDDDSATIINCNILGDLKIYGGGDHSIKLHNTRVSKALINKKDDSVRLVLKGASSINDTQVENNCILETEYLSRSLRNAGFKNITVNRKADATLKGKFQNVEIDGYDSKVELQRADIDYLNITKNGKDSEVKSDKYSTITTVDVSAKASFKGDGSIKLLKAHSTGITYEKKPRRIESDRSSYEPDYENGNNGITIDPKNEEERVSEKTDITIKFDEPVYDKKGRSIRDKDIDDLVELREGSKRGDKIKFEGDISSDKKKVTLDPKSHLQDDTVYYVIIDKNSFYTKDGEGNEKFSSKFYTGRKADDFEYTIYPKNGAKDVSISTNLYIKFDEKIYTRKSDRISDSYLRHYVHLKDVTDKGKYVDCDISWSSSSNKIRIYPKEKLKEGHKYQLYMQDSKFRNSNKDYIKRVYSNFTTKGFLNGVNPSLLAALKNAIEDAETLLKNTKISADGSNIFTNQKWIDTATANDFKQNIAEAKKVHSSPSNDLSVKNATKVLNDTSEIFKDSLQDGSKLRPDTSNLDKSIKRAEDKIQSIKDGEILISTNGYDVPPDKEWVTSSTRDKLISAIAIAKNSLTDESVDTAQKVFNELKKINDAAEAFDNAKSNGTKPDIEDLEDVIKRATAVSKDLQVLSSEDAADNLTDGDRYVLESDMQALINAKTAAVTLKTKVKEHNTAIQQTAIDTATVNLATAIDVFQNAIKTKE